MSDDSIWITITPDQNSPGDLELTFSSESLNDGGELTIHNKTSHPLSIWFSNSADGSKNDSVGIFENWYDFTDSANHLILHPGNQTPQHQVVLKRRNKPNKFSIWFNVDSAAAQASDDGGGLSKNKEIVVTPP